MPVYQKFQKIQQLLSCGKGTILGDGEVREIMAYKTILFDLDGTLLDTLEDLADAVNHILERHRCPQRTLDEVRAFVGNGLGMLMRRALPSQYSQTVSDLLAEELRTYYTAHCREKTAPYSGIPELLTALRAGEARIAVVSNKADEAVGELCSFYFPGLLDTAVGETADRRPKPAPDTVELALERLRVDKSDAVYVGDSQVDVDTARAAGLPCIAVTWGFRSREDLVAAGAETLADTPEQLLQILQEA